MSYLNLFGDIETGPGKGKGIRRAIVHEKLYDGTWGHGRFVTQYRYRTEYNQIISTVNAIRVGLKNLCT